MLTGNGRKFTPCEFIVVNLLCSPCLLCMNLFVCCLVICCNGTDCACIYFSRTDDFNRRRRILPKYENNQ